VSAGSFALYANTTGNYNTSSGYSSLLHNAIGASNAAYGRNALYSNTSGSSNVAVGDSAGYNLTSGSSNIDIANEGVGGESSTIRIGASGTQTRTFIAGIAGTPLTGSAVYVSSSGQLGVLASSERYKTHIAPMGSASEGARSRRPDSSLA